MSWLQKISSVTFSLEGSDKISQPKDISDLGRELHQFATQRIGQDIEFDTIQSDGSGEGLTGTINWYVNENLVSQADQQAIMREWIEEMRVMDFEIQMRGPERSGMNDWNRDPSEPEIIVYRLDVLENGSESYAQIPEINIAQTNAIAIFNTLGIPFDQGGAIDIYDLQQRLSSLKEYHRGEHTRPRSDEGGPGTGNVRSIDFGLDADRMDGYLSGLTRMVDFGIKNGYTNIQWG